MSPVPFTPNVQRLRDRLMEVTNMRYSYTPIWVYISARFWCFIVFEVPMGARVRCVCACALCARVCVLVRCSTTVLFAT
jgi:hypothetical protein